MSAKIVRAMTDFGRFGMDIRVECWCGHVAVLPTAPVLTLFREQRWADDVGWGRRYFRCTRCGRRGAKHLGEWER